MFIPQHLYLPLAVVNDSVWQRLLDKHKCWQVGKTSLDQDHQAIAFHILYSEGSLASSLTSKSISSHEFDAVEMPASVFQDPELTEEVLNWAALHANNFGVGQTTKMGWYVIGAGGTLGYHVDGPIFLNGQRVDLSQPHIQRGIMELNASHRTILPLRFNPGDAFMICGESVPLQRGHLFEFSNVLPHAYFNTGSEDAVLLVTTHLAEERIPVEYSYERAVSELAGSGL